MKLADGQLLYLIGSVMKICEIIKTKLVPPTAVKQRARIRGIVKQIAASQVNQPVTNLEKVLAMQAYAKEKRQVDRQYAALGIVKKDNSSLK